MACDIFENGWKDWENVVEDELGMGGVQLVADDCVLKIKGNFS